MSDPHVYPETPNAPLLLLPAAGTLVPIFTPIEQLAAPDPVTPQIPKTMFIRVAMSGADCLDVTGPTAPNFHLRADSGDPILVNDHAQPPNQTVPIFRRPGSGLADFIGEASAFIEDDNVFRLVIAFNDGAGEYAWQLGIANSDPAAARQFTWVVSGTLAGTAQAWIDVSPAALSFGDVLAEDSKAESITISNKGTGPFAVTGVTPALPDGLALGGLPASLPPNTSQPVIVTFTAPARPSSPDGIVTATVAISTTPADKDAGTGAGHNQQLRLSAHVSVPDTWAARARLPTGRTRLGLAAASNGKLYAVGGAHPGDPALRALEEYDPATDTWTSKAPMPTARTALRLAAAGNGRLYAVGGSDSDAAAEIFQTFATVEEYDPASDTWTTKAPMLEARSGFGLAVGGNGMLYAVGGVDADLNDLATLEEYDPATDRWTSKAPMPRRQTIFGFAAAANGKLYVFGVISFDTTPTVNEYDPATGLWAAKTSAPTFRIRFEVATGGNGKIYLVGGEDHFTHVGTVEEYDPLTDSWATKNSMPTARGWHALAAAPDGKLYAVGGTPSVGTNEDGVEVYTPGR